MHMAHALASNGHEVTLFAKLGDAMDRSVFDYYGLPQSFELKLIPMSGRQSLARYLLSVYRAAKPDIAIGRYLYPLLLQSYRGIPVIYETHAPEGRLKAHFERQIMRRPSYCGTVFITDALRTAYETISQGTECKTLVLPDAARDHGPPEPLHTQSRLQIGFAGSWHAGRGIGLLCDLARLLPDCEFHVAGGSREDLLQLGLQPPVNFHCRDFMPPAKVAEFLQAMDVLLAPYDQHVHTQTQHLDIGAVLISDEVVRVYGCRPDHCRIELASLA